MLQDPFYSFPNIQSLERLVMTAGHKDYEIRLNWVHLLNITRITKSNRTFARLCTLAFQILKKIVYSNKCLAWQTQMTEIIGWLVPHPQPNPRPWPETLINYAIMPPSMHYLHRYNGVDGVTVLSLRMTLNEPWTMNLDPWIGFLYFELLLIWFRCWCCSPLGFL